MFGIFPQYISCIRHIGHAEKLLLPASTQLVQNTLHGFRSAGSSLFLCLPEDTHARSTYCFLLIILQISDQIIGHTI